MAGRELHARLQVWAVMHAGACRCFRLCRVLLPGLPLVLRCCCLAAATTAAAAAPAAAPLAGWASTRRRRRTSIRSGGGAAPPPAARAAAAMRRSTSGARLRSWWVLATSGPRAGAGLGAGQGKWDPPCSSMATFCLQAKQVAQHLKQLEVMSAGSTNKPCLPSSTPWPHCPPRPAGQEGGPAFEEAQGDRHGVHQ